MKRILLFLLGISISAVSLAQSASPDTNSTDIRYRRSSLYSVLVSHPSKKMNQEIVTAFMALQTPDKFNNHDLPYKMFTTESKRDDDIKSEAEEFLNSFDAPKGLVSKWFDRDPEMGWFDPELILARGAYSASDLDVQTAKQIKLGEDVLADAGFELIGNTFIIVNDITYIDKEANAQKASAVLSIIGALAGAVASGTSDNEKVIAQSVEAAAVVGAVISDVIAGFTVKITTYLYQLEWNDDIADNFYDNYYFERPADSLALVAFNQDQTYYEKKNIYERARLFSLKYIGSYNAKSSKTVMRGLNEPADVFRKVCARAIDNNIVALQKQHDAFKVKVPLYSTAPITAKIGMKEGVDHKCKYEVILPIKNEETGKTKYKRVGVIKPIRGQIWDNRYMSVEEEAENATINATQFKKVSGGEFYPGMLIREIGYSTGNTSE